MDTGFDKAPPDWAMPAGVNRGLWDYLHSEQLARDYDAVLADSALIMGDLAFVARHCPVPGRLLDLGCGTGRLLITFARQGYRVVGVDLSLPMLRQAARKALEADVAVDLVQGNLAELDFLAAESFDYAACMFSTLGMVQGAEQRQGVVGQVFRLLRPGGRFILHVHNLWFNAWQRSGRRWLLRNLAGALRGRGAAGDRVMPVHQGIAGLTLHLYTQGEACRSLRRAGFRTVEIMPLGFGTDLRLARPWWLGGLRAHGYLCAAEKPTTIR